MANFKSNLVTARESLRYSDKAAVDGIRTGAALLLATATIILVGTEVANDTLQLFDLPAGCEIVPQLSHVTCSADPSSGTLTLDVGDAGDIDRYADNILLANGGQVFFCSGTMPAAVATPFLTTVNTRIYATIVAASALPTANVRLVFTIAYRITG